MKRFISILLMLILMIVLGTTIFARWIPDLNTPIKVDQELEYPDLQLVAYDLRGKPIKDRETKEQLYVYHYATNEVLKASEIGLIQGYEDGTFIPEASITKAEFIKLAIVLSTNRNFDFSAIPSKLKHWAAPYVAVAEMQGVVAKGHYNLTNLDKPVTRIEMICILSKIQINMKGISQYRDAVLPTYPDINNLTEEEKEMLLHACKYELLANMFERDEAGNVLPLRPYDNLTRGDAAIAIMRVY